MKRWICALLMVMAVVLGGCAQGITQNAQDVPTLYPGDTGIELEFDEAKVIPSEIFTTTAEENGLQNEIYLLTGEMGEYFYQGESAFFWLHTKQGDVVVIDTIANQSLRNDDGIDHEDLRQYCPLPKEGEQVRMVCQYSGMSNTFGAPSFIYTSEDYLVEAMMESLFGDLLSGTGEETDESHTATTSSTLEMTVHTTTEVLMTTEATTTKPTVPTTTVVAVSIGKQNALKEAKSYLRSMPFSYQGLIEQLEYEGYTHEEAVYGAEHCDADWFEQAEKEARGYLRSMSFSYQGLIEQLEYEGYTHEEALYGVDRCGADWFEQAAKEAKSYLDSMSFSKDGLISQLEYEGFTHEQAVYGAEANGY